MEYKLTYRKSPSRLLALVMVICMLSSAFLENAASAASSPADIRGAWSERTLLEWMDKGWLTGYPDGTVKPKLEVTRAEFFSLANKSLGFADEATISFSDVKPGTWKAKQAAIAVQAGYAEGYPNGTMQPDRKITREEVSIMVAKAFDLKLNPGETSKFMDAASITNAGKGAVGALVAAGILKGYPDGSFKPKKVITREEAVVILDGALKKLERKNDKDRAFSAAGSYGPADGTETIAGNAVVEASGVTLRNMEIQGDLLLSANIGEGEATLDNVKVKGTVTVNGGGPNSIYLKDSQLELLIMDKKNGSVRIVAKGSTTVKRVDLRSGAKLESDAAKDKGFRTVHLTKEMPAGAKAILLGEFAEANVASSKGALELIRGAIQKLNVLSGASGNTMKLEENTQVVELTLEEEAKVQGQGAIDRAILDERAKGSTFERVPGKLESKDAPSPSPSPSPSSSPSPGSGGGSGGGGNQDTTPPAAPVVEGVQDQGIYVGSVTPNWSDASGTTSTATLIKNGSDKVSYARNTEIAEDGSYILSVTAVKNSNGMRTTTTIHFTIDSVPPTAPKIEGVANGGRYFSALPDWTDAPNTVSEALISQHGHGAKPYERGTRIEEEGDYVLTVTAKKVNGLTASTTVRFSIDSSAVIPAVVEGVEEGGAYSSIVITWIDASRMNSTATLAKDGGAAAPFNSGTEITEEGDYVLTVTTRNVLSNETAEQQIHFTISDQPAAAEIAGVEEGGTYASVIVNWVDALDTESTATLAKNGGAANPFVSGTEIKEDGRYVLTVTTAWNVNSKTVQQRISFTIDSVPPLAGWIEVNGLSRVKNSVEVLFDAKLYWEDVEPAGSTSSAMLVKDGGAPVPYVKNTLIEENGDYELTVTWTKRSNGLKVVRKAEFKVDYGPMGPILSGFADKEIYFEPVTMSWEPYEGTTIYSADLSNEKTEETIPRINSPMYVEDDGFYNFFVTVKDSGHDYKEYIYQFAIIGIRGVTEGGVYENAKPDWFNPFSYSTATLSKDGGPAVIFIKGTEIAEDGAYVLTVTWTSNDWKPASQSVGFTIYSTPPEPADITIEGDSRKLSGEEVYFTASATWTDQAGTTSTAMLRKGNEEPVPYTKNTLIDQDGDYELTVTTTKRSKTSTATRAFKVDTGPARPILSGFSDDAILFGPVEISWTTPEGTKIDWVTLWNESTNEQIDPLTNPTTVHEAGEYEFNIGVSKGIEIRQYAYQFMIAEIRGVEEGGVYDHATPDWLEPGSLGTAEATLSKDGGSAIPYLKGDTIYESGEYVLTVTWRNDAGNSESKSIHFTIDSAPPAPVTVTGVVYGGSYSSVSPTWNDAAGLTITATLSKDGGTPESYEKGTPISEVGSYVLTVTATNADGLSAETTIAFTIEEEGPVAPTIELNGVPNFEHYLSVTPTWTDAEGTTSTATLTRTWEDGEPPVTIPYESGTRIDEEGDYVLTVTTTKTSNGLTATTTVTFRVTTEVP